MRESWSTHRERERVGDEKTKQRPKMSGSIKKTQKK